MSSSRICQHLILRYRSRYAHISILLRADTDGMDSYGVKSLIHTRLFLPDLSTGSFLRLRCLQMPFQTSCHMLTSTTFESRMYMPGRARRTPIVLNHAPDNICGPCAGRAKTCELSGNSIAESSLLFLGIDQSYGRASATVCRSPVRPVKYRRETGGSTCRTASSERRDWSA